MAGPGDSRLKANTSPPQRHALDYAIDGRHYNADLYLPAQAPRAGIVLVPGVVPEGKDDPRLVLLAQTLARLRFAVLVPDLKGLRRLQVRAHDVTEVADAFRFLITQPEWAPQGRAGIAGISYGAGPVLLAALKPDIREQVHFIVALGGYYDLPTLVTYFTTGHYREEAMGEWRDRSPAQYIKWVFALSNIDLLERIEDRDALRAYAESIFKGAPIEAPNALAPDARALHALLGNHNPDLVPALIAQLSPRIRSEIKGLDPAAHDLSLLNAQAILVHGRGDTMIPYTQSVALAQALPPGQARLFLIEGFAHVDIQAQQQDIPQLLRAMEALLAQRAPVSR